MYFEITYLNSVYHQKQGPYQEDTNIGNQLYQGNGIHAGNQILSDSRDVL